MGLRFGLIRYGELPCSALPASNKCQEDLDASSAVGSILRQPYFNMPSNITQCEYSTME